MIFTEGYLKPYSLLRYQNPSIYNLEELHFKVLPIKLTKEGKIFIDEEDLTEETFLTLNFPEFLDTTTNLSLIKSIHFSTDLSLNLKDDLQELDGEDEIRLVKQNVSLKTHFKNEIQYIEDLIGLPIPPNLYKLYLGYRHTPLLDIRGHITGIESVVSKKLAKMEDDCFSWIEVTDGEGIKQKTEKTSVLKFKVVYDLDVLKSWINTLIPLEKRDTLFQILREDELYFNFIVHPPYMGRMSFKNSVEIIYPQRTTILKMLDRISFRVNKTFTEGNKYYKIEIIDKTTDQKLYIFDNVDNSELFSNIERKIDTRKVNSYFDKELTTFQDAIVVNFSIPYPVQRSLASHKNYKIRITAKDLTSLDTLIRG